MVTGLKLAGSLGMNFYSHKGLLNWRLNVKIGEHAGTIALEEGGADEKEKSETYCLCRCSCADY